MSSVAEFRKVWAGDFSLYPDVVQVSETLSAQMRRDPKVNPEVKRFLASGGSPLALGNGSLIDALEAAYLGVIKRAGLPEDREKKLILALTLASQDLRRLSPGDPGFLAPPGDGSGGGEGGFESGGSGESVPPDFDKILRDAANQRCVVRTGILFFVSNLINVVGALQAKWQEYAGADAAFLPGLLSPAAYQKAAQDPHFRHNITWNAILMLSLGALSCMRNRAMGRNIVTLISAITSIAGQYVSNGEVSVSQTLLDALFVRFISLQKTTLVFRMAEGYRRIGAPAPLLLESSLQVVSESVGSFLYPRAQMLSAYLFDPKKPGEEGIEALSSDSR